MKKTIVILLLIGLVLPLTAQDKDWKDGLYNGLKLTFVALQVGDYFSTMHPAGRETNKFIAYFREKPIQFAAVKIVGTYLVLKLSDELIYKHSKIAGIISMMVWDAAYSYIVYKNVKINISYSVSF